VVTIFIIISIIDAAVAVVAIKDFIDTRGEIWRGVLGNEAFVVFVVGAVLLFAARAAFAAIVSTATVAKVAIQRFSTIPTL